MGERGISPVVGVVLLAGIVVLLIAVAAYAVVGVSENALGTAAVHSQSNYDVDIENEKNKQLTMDLRGFQDRAPDTEFVLSINDKAVRRWQGRGDDDIGIECLYPGDEVQLISANGDTTVLLEDFEVENPTECTKYNSFENKFPNAVVDGTTYQVRDEYELGLSIVPDGDSSIGKISLQNDWHYVKLVEDRTVNGLEPPVFIIVATDNVHRSNVPSDSLPDVPTGAQYDWDDAPPSGLNPGADSWVIENGKFKRGNGGTAVTEPTNDLFFVFKPGCDESTLVLTQWSGTYENDIYLGDQKVIDDTTAVSTPKEFDTPGVECPNGFSW